MMNHIAYTGKVFKDSDSSRSLLGKNKPVNVNSTFGHCPDCGHQFQYFFVEKGQECPHCHNHNVIAHYPFL